MGVFTVLHTGMMNGLCKVIGRTVGMDVFTVLHTGDDERFVQINWVNCWYGCVYGTEYKGMMNGLCKVIG